MSKPHPQEHVVKSPCSNAQHSQSSPQAPPEESIDTTLTESDTPTDTDSLTKEQPEPEDNNEQVDETWDLIEIMSVTLLIQDKPAI